jgi:hypothetical protein
VFTAAGWPAGLEDTKMVCFDDTAGVYEVYSDIYATKWLGAYADYGTAIRVLYDYLGNLA